jgi:hypothetical protein
MGAAIGTWLLKNPLAGGLAGLLAIVSLAAGVQTLRLAWAESARHGAELALSDYKREAAENSLAEERKAKADSDRKIGELVAETKAIGAAAQQAKTEIRFVQSNGGPCAVDPAFVAAVRGMRAVLDAGPPAPGGAVKARP